ncbi:hypothetical protein KEM48_001832 [Puccinia striiformis f. sp. tritici PST-130]|nr:hypothetical protein KEM48_001832 [Puccinia striiformis f. sp. tritici PST-130]
MLLRFVLTKLSSISQTLVSSKNRKCSTENSQPSQLQSQNKNNQEIEDGTKQSIINSSERNNNNNNEKNKKRRKMIDQLSRLIDLENLRTHYHIILFSTIGCFTIQLISHHILSPKLFPHHYPKLSNYTKFNWDIRVVAWVHAFYATAIAVHVLSNPTLFTLIHQDKLFGYQVRAIIIYRSQLVISYGTSLLLLCRFLILYQTFWCLLRFRFLLWEASTIFLNPHWFFDKIGMSGSKAQLYNGVALLLVFFFSVLGNYTSYQLFALSFEDGVSQKAGSRLLNTIRVLDLLLSGLNIFWFYQMISSVLNRFSTKSTTRSSKSDTNKIKQK